MLDVAEALIVEQVPFEHRQEVRDKLHESPESRAERERLEQLVGKAKLDQAARAMSRG